MANGRVPSIYEQYWVLVRETRWKTYQRDDPSTRVVLNVPEHLHARVVKAIRKRKDIEFNKNCKDYGSIKSISNGTSLTLWLVPRKWQVI